MYTYKLIRNHYVVEIEGKHYLIDTGHPKTLSLNAVPIVIDGEQFCTAPFNADIRSNAMKLIGAEIDGLIGFETLSRTSLTIYKDGRMDFARASIEGAELPITVERCSVLTIPAIIEGNRKVKAILDTGAAYYYGDYARCFTRTDYVGEFDDYNPYLNWFRSRFYKQKVQIATRMLELNLGDYEKINNMVLSYPGVAMFINITELFEKAIVIDFVDRKLVMR